MTFEIQTGYCSENHHHIQRDLISHRRRIKWKVNVDIKNDSPMSSRWGRHSAIAFGCELRVLIRSTSFRPLSPRLHCASFSLFGIDVFVFLAFYNRAPVWWYDRNPFPVYDKTSFTRDPWSLFNGEIGRSALADARCSTDLTVRTATWV